MGTENPLNEELAKKKTAVEVELEVEVVKKRTITTTTTTTTAKTETPKETTEPTENSLKEESATEKSAEVPVEVVKKKTTMELMEEARAKLAVARGSVMEKEGEIAAIKGALRKLDVAKAAATAAATAKKAVGSESTSGDGGGGGGDEDDKVENSLKIEVIKVTYPSTTVKGDEANDNDNGEQDNVGETEPSSSPPTPILSSLDIQLSSPIECVTLTGPFPTKDTKDNGDNDNNNNNNNNENDGNKALFRGVETNMATLTIAASNPDGGGIDSTKSAMTSAPHDVAPLCRVPIDVLLGKEKTKGKNNEIITTIDVAIVTGDDELSVDKQTKCVPTAIVTL